MNESFKNKIIVSGQCWKFRYIFYKKIKVNGLLDVLKMCYFNKIMKINC